MNRNNMNRRGHMMTFVSGFFFGALTGAVVALLTAPQSGEETRQDLMDKSIDLQKKVGKAVDTAQATVEETVDNVVEKAEELQGNGSKAVSKSRKHVEKAVDELEKAADEIAKAGAR